MAAFKTFTFCLLVFFGVVVANTINISDETIAKGFKIAKDILNMWNERTKDLKKIQIKYNGKSSRSRWQKYTEQDSIEPFDKLLQQASRLRQEPIDDTCELYFYDNKELFVIQDNEGLFDAIEDSLVNGKLLIELKCDDYDELSDDRLQLIKQKKAYQYVTTLNSKSKDELQKAEQSLNDAGIGGFDIIGDGIELDSVDKNEFDSKVMKIAEASGWDETIKQTILAATSAKSQKKGTSKIKFDAANWKITGHFIRYATFEASDGKYSLFMATSSFSVSIPYEARKGSLPDKVLPWFNGGTLNGEYMKLIELLLESKAMEKFRVAVGLPKLLQGKNGL